MRVGHILSAFAGTISLAASAPARGHEHKHRSLLASGLLPQNTTLLGHGGNVLSGIGQLAQVSQVQQLIQFSEEDLVAQLNQQVLLAAGLQGIKDNIRLNSLRARFSQVNTVLVTVTTVVDARNPLNINQRYLMNHILVDNGFPDKQQVVMVTDSQTYTVTTASTSSAETAETTETTEEAATSTFDLGSLLASAATATPTASSLTLPIVTGAGLGLGQAAIVQQQRTIITSFNPAAGLPVSFDPSQILLLPYDTVAPSNPLTIEDPANIIYDGASHLLVEGMSNIQSDCAALGLGGGFFGGGANLALFGSVQQAISFQLTTISVGSAVQAIPPSVLLAHPDLSGVFSAPDAASSASVYSSSTASEASATAYYT